ncbi:MAG: cytochrome PufQ [Pseudomonadota bacterium]
MTDQTTDLSGFAPGPAQARDVRPLRREFMAYFAVIFVATLPLAVLTWALQAARQFRLPEKGPIARAWSQARIITPMIFAA